MLINLDWLQIHCKGSLKSIRKPLSFVPKGFQTRQFKTLGELCYKRKLVATVSADPHADILSSDTILIKFDNSILYRDGLKDFLYSEIFANLPDVKLHGLSRVDISCDFNEFKDGLDPHDFLVDHLAQKYLRNGRGGKRIEGQDFSKLDAKENTRHTWQSYHYLRFGKHNSEKSIYLYNKSKEFKDKGTKTHILKSWIASDTVDHRRDVWRLELSLKGNNIFLDKKTKGLPKGILQENIEGSPNFEQITIDSILEPEVLRDVWMTGVKHLFRFKINNGTKNKTRMADLHLFDLDTEFNRIREIPERNDVTRSNRVFINHLHNHTQELKGNFEMSSEILTKLQRFEVDLLSQSEFNDALETKQKAEAELERAIKTLEEYADRHGLVDYLNHKRGLGNKNLKRGRFG